MESINNYYLFLISAIMLNMTPGTDTIFIVSKSISQGKKAGIFSALGVMTGVVLHTILITSGLSIIIAKSTIVFFIIKYCGAVCLIYLGVQILIKKEITFGINPKLESRVDNRKIYFQGMITDILNPKMILFFLTFLPQFILPGKGNPQIGLFILGATFVCTGTIWCLLLVYFSSYITKRARDNKTLSIILNKLTGVVFIGLGLKVGFGR